MGTILGIGIKRLTLGAPGGSMTRVVDITEISITALIAAAPDTLET